MNAHYSNDESTPLKGGIDVEGNSKGLFDTTTAQKQRKKKFLLMLMGIAIGVLGVLGVSGLLNTTTISTSKPKMEILGFDGESSPPQCLHFCGTGGKKERPCGNSCIPGNTSCVKKTRGSACWAKDMCTKLCGSVLHAGQACGDACISKQDTCYKTPDAGFACNKEDYPSVAKSKKDEGSFCDADFECNSNNCYIQKCVVKIEGSIPFPKFDFALLFLSEPAYAIDAFDGNGELYAYPENRSGAQRFRAEKDGSIIHVTSNKALAVDGSTFMHGNHLKLKARDGTLAQQWVAFNNGRIANKKSGFFITFALGKNEHNPPLTIERSPTENYYAGVQIDVRALRFARV